MIRRPQIQSAVRDEIDDILNRSGEYFRAGDLTGALELALKAWNLIPDPKHEWDYYPQSLSVSFVADYTDIGDVEAVKRWINEAYLAYGDPDRENHYTLMLEGSSLYKLGLKDDAYLVFDRIFSTYGRDGFKGDQREYLEFFLRERARRDG